MKVPATIQSCPLPLKTTFWFQSQFNIAFRKVRNRDYAAYKPTNLFQV